MCKQTEVTRGISDGVHGRNGRSKYLATKVARLIYTIGALKRAVSVLCYVRRVLVNEIFFGKVQIKVGVTKKLKGTAHYTLTSD